MYLLSVLALAPKNPFTIKQTRNVLKILKTEILFLKMNHIHVDKTGSTDWIIILNHYEGKKMEKTFAFLTSWRSEFGAVTLVLPHSSASDWECLAEASARKPPSSFPPPMGLTGQGRSMAAGSPRGCLTEKYIIKLTLN